MGYALILILLPVSDSLSQFTNEKKKNFFKKQLFLPAAKVILLYYFSTISFANSFQVVFSLLQWPHQGA